MNDLLDEARVKAGRLLKGGNLSGPDRDWLERVMGDSPDGLEVLRVLELYAQRAREAALAGNQLDYFDDD